MTLRDKGAADQTAQTVAETAARPRRRILLEALPFAAMGVVGVIDLVAGPDLAFLQLLSLGPALAAVYGTVRRTVIESCCTPRHQRSA